MNITYLLIALWFILWGIMTLGIFAVSSTALGFIALVAGIAMLVTGLGVDTTFKRNNQ